MTAVTTNADLIRNIGFIAHIDAGKTTVTERVLYLTGRIRKVGGVDEGTTAMDWMPQEKERGITITAAATTAYWRDHQVNIIDTPGHVDFTAEVERSLRVLDGGIVVLDAVAGVQPQSETVWRQADTYDVPRICFVNKMDRVGASYERTIESIRRRLKGNPVAVQVPIGAEDEFRGVVDLIEGQAIMYSDGRDDVADPPELMPVPLEYEQTYHDYRQEMIEKIVETDEALLIKYLEGEDICADDLRSALRNATINRQLVPVLCGSAMRGKGIDPLLDAIICYLPSPLDVPAVEGHRPRYRRRRDPRTPGQRTPVGAGLQGCGRPLRGPARVPAYLLRNGRIRSRRAQRDPGQPGAHGPAAADARQPPGRTPGDHRRQHLRGRRTERHFHRRHHLHRPQAGDPRTASLP